MSRAEPAGQAGVGAAARSALVDFYYHSIRFVPANVVWGVGFLGVLGLAWLLAPWTALAAVPLLGLPLAGIARLAALVVRGEDVVLSDAWSAWRASGRQALALGAALTLAALVLITNIDLGLRLGGPVGWALATLAGWGALALWVVAFPLWVVLVDPAREEWPLVDRARLAGLLVLARTGPMLRLAVVLAVVLAVSTLLFAALLTIGVAYAMLVAARVTLPAADGVSARGAYRFPAVRLPVDVPEESAAS